MDSINPHDWHTLDAERGLEVRQVSATGEDNRWEVRTPDGETQVLTDEEFDQLRSGG